MRIINTKKSHYTCCNKYYIKHRAWCILGRISIKDVGRKISRSEGATKKKQKNSKKDQK